MGRRAELEGIQEEAELDALLLLGDSENLEYCLLDFLTVANFYATSGSMDYMVGIEGTAMTITE